MESAFSTGAQAAKEKAKKLFLGAAVGLTKLGDQEMIKVNLPEPLAPGADMPDSIDGIPIKLEVVGKVRAL